MVEDLHIRVTELETENESLKAKQTSDTSIAQLHTEYRLHRRLRLCSHLQQINCSVPEQFLRTVLATIRL